jgi:beta-lactamase regulating signal transducer with metallopeptidase domain
MLDEAAIVTEALLNACWQGVAVTALMWLMLRLMRGSASARFVIWWITLAAVLSLPWIHWPAAAAIGQLTRPPQLTLSSSFSLVLLVAWLLIAAVMLLRLAWGYCYIRWLARTATPLGLGYQERAARLTGARDVLLWSSRETAVPIVIGLRSPVILMPAGLPDRLDPAEFDQIVLHEWAHIRRRDAWSNLALELIKAVFFFHPAVWWIGRALALEREIACDDAVVAFTRAPVPYAGCLTKLVEMTACPPATLTPGAIGDARALFQRVERLLGRRRHHGFSALRIAASAAVIAAAVATCSQAPALVRVDAPGRLALAQPRPAIELNRRTIVAEERLRAADILLETANQRLREADDIMRRAQQMRLAGVWAADGNVLLPRVSATRYTSRQAVVIFFKEI